MIDISTMNEVLNALMADIVQLRTSCNEADAMEAVRSARADFTNVQVSVESARSIVDDAVGIQKAWAS